MHYVYLLALLFGVSNAAQPSPVYRAAPTILNSAPANKPAERSSGLPVTVADGTPAPQTAQERESQAFPPTSQEKISNGATANIQTPSIQSGSKATGSQPGEQVSLLRNSVRNAATVSKSTMPLCNRNFCIVI